MRSLGLTSSFPRIFIYWMTLRISWGALLVSFGFKIFKILRIMSFFFRMYEDLYWERIWRIFYFSNLIFFVLSTGYSPSIFEYWLTFYFLLKSKSTKLVCLGLGKSGKILYFFGEGLRERFWSNYFRLKAALGIASSFGWLFLAELMLGKFEVFSFF